MAEKRGGRKEGWPKRGVAEKWGTELKLYRQVAISVVKKHIPAIIASFDPNAPTEYAMFLKTLAYQTGHTIQTHSRSYALDNNYPAKLQADLIDRYYQSSLLWHQFLLLGEGDPLLCQTGSKDLDIRSSQAVEYSPDLPLSAQDDESESIEIEIEEQTQLEDLYYKQ